MAIPQIQAQLEHVSAGCNRVRGCLDWSANGLVAAGSHNAVILYAWEVWVAHVLSSRSQKSSSGCTGYHVLDINKALCSKLESWQS